MSELERGQGSLADLLCALSFATGMAVGERFDHGLKSAYIGLQLADALKLPAEDREAIFYGALLKDVGCTACAAGFATFFPDDEQVPRLDFMLVDPTRLSEMIGWLTRNVHPDGSLPTRITKLVSFMAQCGPIVKEAMRGHCEIAQLFARQLGFSDNVQQTLRFQWERWDGKGIAYHVKGPAVPIASRILHVAQMVEFTHHAAGRSATQVLAQEKRGTRFDPEVAGVFLTLAERADFWHALEHEHAESAILAMKPFTAAERAHQAQVDRVCEGIADLVDVKTRQTWNHSRSVAEVALAIGHVLGLGPAERTKLHRAALVHDVGKVAIPYGILVKADNLSHGEQEIVRLHPYYTERLLERVVPLRELAKEAGAHHEWVNGQGYHRGLSGQHIPLLGRVLAVADAYVHHRGKGDQQMDVREVVRPMWEHVGTRFDRSCYDALEQAVIGGDRVEKPTRRQQRDGLTEREIEVVRLLAQGLTNPQIAQALVISRKTVEHHLGHVYDKLNISCRTAAVAYAVQKQLV